MQWIYSLLETGIVPEGLIRWGIRQMLARKIKEHTAPSLTVQQERLMQFIADLKKAPIAIETDAANEQHYEVPSSFYTYVLGKHRKYSSGLWGPGVRTLDEAEAAMLALTCERAQLEDGQHILELGCGWGSLSLWMATHYPHAKITALSNSKTQKAFIDAEIARLNLTNLTVVTANIVHYETDLRYDRVVSVEMFEHMKNYDILLQKVSTWMNPGAKLFVHIFTHKTFAYHYDASDPSDWLTRYFFTGGTMPSDDLLLYFQQDLAIEDHWVVSGTHYEKTANAWLTNMKQNKKAINPILADTYGPQQVKRWWVYWRVFFLACAELWGYRQGQEWQVSHYRFTKLT